MTSTFEKEIFSALACTVDSVHMYVWHSFHLPDPRPGEPRDFDPSTHVVTPYRGPDTLMFVMGISHSCSAIFNRVVNVLGGHCG